MFEATCDNRWIFFSDSLHSNRRSCEYSEIFQCWYFSWALRTFVRIENKVFAGINVNARALCIIVFLVYSRQRHIWLDLGWPDRQDVHDASNHSNVSDNTKPIESKIMKHKKRHLSDERVNHKEFHKLFCLCYVGIVIIRLSRPSCLSKHTELQKKQENTKVISVVFDSRNLRANRAKRFVWEWFSRSTSVSGSVSTNFESVPKIC